MADQLFTAAKPKPGQAEIPMGTHHLDAEGNSFICDTARCQLPFTTTNHLPHSTRQPYGNRAHQCDLFQSEMF